MSFVLQTPTLNPFSKKKVKSKKIMCNYCSFCFSFPYPCVAKPMSVADNFITYVQMMNVYFIVKNTFYIVNEIL